jgi:hypothetical protein
VLCSLRGGARRHLRDRRRQDCELLLLLGPILTLPLFCTCMCFATSVPLVAGGARFWVEP